MDSQPHPDSIEVVISREPRKSLALRPKPGLLIVKAPLLASDTEIANFIARHQIWVRRHCAIKPASYLLHGKEIDWSAPSLGDLTFDQPPPQNLRSRIYRRICSAATQQVFNQVICEQGSTIPPLRIGSMASAWGRCHASGRVELHWRVGSLPLPLGRYVVFHELAHLKHLDHSSKFWSYLATLDPQSRKHDRELNAWHL